ncbi:BTB and MATH domain-containing protein 45 [Caenorhabditis elegans]|uniref:BTB and MATH domain-containing protein 45 n=1 Tax=Caenorhabditis elegans TaxID=6239 RepID=BAT45_CAEEL|nr:BTB and MATH domain-containing protein 45 [Caenorhabditis elegans]Q9XV51.1 RecName: Full=BTB and MATH domain-containing protein 45 [Caenorhabditis elegans]CAB04217.1 BTB and MATH domain-containing protein 45 [Caenorhabditis elegans]|eukprot:NP_496788.1 BTB and MATH domain-containing protein 45 [Caenorhabditis elegans]
MAAAHKVFELSHVFKDVSKIGDDESVCSPNEDYFGVPWKIVLRHKDEKMGVFLSCEKPSNNDAHCIVNVVYSVKLMSSSGVCYIKSDSKLFGEITEHGWVNFVNWNTMVDAFLIDDSIIIEVLVKTIFMSGLPKKSPKNFDESNKEFSDGIVVVKHQNFHILKKFLAFHCEYLEKLFFGDFKEAGKAEVTLKAISSTDFHYLLAVLYEDYAIDDDNVGGILRLASYLQVPIVIRKCEQFLIEGSGKPMEIRLDIAEKECLQNLKKHCLSKVGTADQIEAARAILPSDIPKRALKKFDESNKEFSDVIFVVEHNKFYVLKQILASHSSHFKKIFVENVDKREFTLADIDSNDFQNLVEVMYGVSFIDDLTVEGVLHLAHMYDRPFPMQKCVEFLIDLSEKSPKEKLKIAKAYQLKNLEKAALARINLPESIRAALSCDMAQMEVEVLKALMQKALFHLSDTKVHTETFF